MRSFVRFQRQWEQEHREQRNAQRRMRRLEVKAGPLTTHPAPDPRSNTKPKSGWKGIVGLAVGLGVVLLAALGGVNVPGQQSFE
jgi:ferric-dicitrate binding protein FerR (iron transport regulator)